jgi:GxxExxY protein
MNIYKDYKHEKKEITYEPELNICNEIEIINSIKDFDNNINQICESIRKTLGSKNLENTYQRALRIDLEEMNVFCNSEVSINLMYKNKCIGTRRADLIITLPNQEKALIELKAITKLTSENLKQLQYYMNHFDINIGYLINFPHESGFPDSFGGEDEFIFKYSFLDGTNENDKILSDRQLRNNNALEKTEILKIEKCQKNKHLNLKKTNLFNTKDSHSAVNNIASLCPARISNSAGGDEIVKPPIMSLYVKQSFVPTLSSKPPISVSKSDITSNKISYGITKSGTECKNCLKTAKGFCKKHLYQKKI